ncbi:MAG: lipid II flippase MurJ [Methylobacter sp.]|nr:lipid II flippase MurJ [Methylobacter sp.]
MLLVGMPATIGLMLLAEPMLSTLFQYNEFGINDVYLAGQSLRGVILIKVLVPSFTSRQDMKTPVQYGIYSMIASLALNVALVFSFGTCRACSGNVTGRFF